MSGYQIVIGFDGSEGSRRALEWAAVEAGYRGASLKVVRAWTPGEFATNQDISAAAQKSISDAVSEIIGDESKTSVEAVVEQGSAAKVLIAHAAGAEMLVVGSRGRGGFTGLLLGSVGHQVTTHAGAPVVVIVR